MATIRERNGTYQISVYSGFDVNGHRKRQTTTFVPPEGLSPKKREKAVQTFAVEFESRVKNGLILDGEKTTFLEFVDRWRTEYAEQMKANQQKVKQALGAYWKGNNWLFTQSDGSMMSYSTPYVTFQEAIDRYNATADAEHLLPHIPFHGLRHTSATLLIAGHQDLRTVSHRMGHVQTSTTMNIYVHALKESDRTASDLLEGMLGRPAVGSR